MNNTKYRLFTFPNIITLLNILSGCISIVCLFNHFFVLGSIFIFIAGIFDFLDGLAARIARSYSDLGKQLDSLADVVSFGVAPSVILYHLFLMSFNPSDVFSISNLNIGELCLVFSSFLIAAASALRLAKFNLDTRQKDSFIGVPTPANAFVIASLPFILKNYPSIEGYLLQPYVLLSLVLILSYLLISELPLISLKFKNYKWVGNISRYLLLIISGILLAFFNISAFPVIFIVYLAISVIKSRMVMSKPS